MTRVSWLTMTRETSWITWTWIRSLTFVNARHRFAASVSRITETGQRIRIVVPGSVKSTTTSCFRPWRLRIREFPEPDIPEPDWIAVELQPNRRRAMRFRLWWAVPGRLSQDFRVILNQDAIVKHRQVSGIEQRSLGVIARSVVNDV